MGTGPETRMETTGGGGGFQEWERVIGHTIHKLEKERAVGYEVGSETGDEKRGEAREPALVGVERMVFGEQEVKTP